MSSIGTGYDLSCTTFSPDGRVFQVEYAVKAADNSGTAIGLRCKDGVVLGVEKLVISKLLVASSNRRVHTIDSNCGLAVAGLVADARQIVKRARTEADDYSGLYQTPIPMRVLCERIASFVQSYTLFGYLRPFGCSVIVAGCDNCPSNPLEADDLYEARKEKKVDPVPQLYCIDPSGNVRGYYAAAFGKGRSTCKTELEKLKFPELTCKQAVTEIARILSVSHDEGKDKDWELEMSWVCAESGWKHQAVPQPLRDEALAAAKAILEAME